MKMTLSSVYRVVHTAFTTETIACFGQARIVRKADGKVELVGGSRADRANAREWCSLFLHDVVVG
jgi:hypothetical protein